MSFKIVKRGFSTTKIYNIIKNVTVIGGGLMGNGIAQVKRFKIILSMKKPVNT